MSARCATIDSGWRGPLGDLGSNNRPDTSHGPGRRHEWRRPQDLDSEKPTLGSIENLLSAIAEPVHEFLPTRMPELPQACRI